ncbi:MAG: PPC domain-containing DNA-binding protein, partial [Planctomycetota bacterium]
MQARKVAKRRWLLVLERGEELVATVTGFLEDQGILGGFVTGLGALKDHTVGYYDLEKKEYLKRTFEEVMELGNLVGTIGSVDQKPFLHAHVTLAGPELIAFSGHLVRGEVAVTAELLVQDFDQELPREEVEEI